MRLYLLLLLIVVSSCKDKRIDAYNAIVNSTDSAVIYYRTSNDSLTVVKSDLGRFKNILKRNVQPKEPRKFTSSRDISLFKDGRKIASLWLSNDTIKPYVNFQSDSVNFSFRLTYGMGMTVDNYVKPNNR